jgi:6-phosphogluconolactonase
VLGAAVISDPRIGDPRIGDPRIEGEKEHMSQSRFVYVGTYTEPILFGTGQIVVGKGQGIHIYRFDEASGSLEPCGLAAGVRNPSYLAFHPNRRYLYAVNEMKEFEGLKSGAISAFALDPASGELTFINQKATHGTDPCHVIVDPTGQCVLVANFASGSVCVLPIAADGSLGDASEFIQHQGSGVDPKRQAGPHAHAVTLDKSGRRAFVADLGLDKVMIYDLDPARGKLTAHDPAWAALQPGAGPRQVVMAPDDRFAYVINELNSTMTAFSYNAARGRLEQIQTVSTLPEGYTGPTSCAEVQISPRGDLLYGSNRGHDSLAIFRVDQTQGTLTPLGQVSVRGRVPRNFTVDPTGDWVLVANQDTDNITVFRVDHATGALVDTGASVYAPMPVCLKVL